jgi:hypothetical protein
MKNQIYYSIINSVKLIIDLILKDNVKFQLELNDKVKIF